MPRARVFSALAILLFAGASHAQCPSQPTLFGQAGPCAVQLNWNSINLASTVHVYRSSSPQVVGSIIASVPANAGGYVDYPPLLPAGSLYSYRIAGVSQTCPNANNEGTVSAPVNVAPNHMAAPVISQATTACDAGTIAWPAVPNAAGYHVEATFGATTLSNADIPANQLTWTYQTTSAFFNPITLSVAAIGPCETGPADSASINILHTPQVGLNANLSNACDGVRITWSAFPTIDALRITRIASGQPNYNFTAPNTGLAVDSTALPGIHYTYSITPYNTCGDGNTTNIGAEHAALNVPAYLAPVRASVGQTATFTVAPTTTGNTLPPGCQWKRNGATLSDGGRISGSQTYTLSITNVQPEDSDVYQAACSISGCTMTATTALVVPIRCRADYDLSGALGVQDVFAFLNAWFAGCP